MPALPIEIENWLAAHRRVFAEVFVELELNKVVSMDRTVPFSCNDCGRCCFTEDFGIFVYPADIDRMVGSGAFLPICCVLPEEDEEGHLAYAFPSKREWGDLLQHLMQESSENQDVITAYQQVAAALAQLNPDIEKVDDSCIFYANSLSTHRCLIYNVRPTCCRVYPFDRFAISHLQIPPTLAAQYELLADHATISDPAPLLRPRMLHYSREAQIPANPKRYSR